MQRNKKSDDDYDNGKSNNNSSIHVIYLVFPYIYVSLLLKKKKIEKMWHTKKWGWIFNMCTMYIFRKIWISTFLSFSLGLEITWVFFTLLYLTFFGCCHRRCSRRRRRHHQKFSFQSQFPGQPNGLESDDLHFIKSSVLNDGD